MIDQNTIEAFKSLDFALTGKTDCTVNQFSSNRDLYDLVDHEVYLSDGGYSRVVFSWDNRKLRLTSNSRDEVKARWTQVEKERQAVESLLSNWIDRDFK